MSQDNLLYQLRSDIQCHSNDIRSIIAIGDGFITGSRDRTAKAYIPNQKNELAEAQCFIGATHYVSSVSCLINHDDINQSIIFIGSNDATIYAFTLHLSEPKYQLKDHSGTVCALSVNNKLGLLLSGSWDQTGRLWKDEKCEAVFVGHEGGVWSIRSIGDFVVTGSADKTLKLWSWTGEVKCVHTYEGHTDCVRDIAVISETEFLSCSNDATIRHWKITGEIKDVYYGHENYIYSISIINQNEFVTCSEDRTARIWRGDVNGTLSVVQTLRLPVQTLWQVAVLQNQDIVIGASNGKVYVYTRHAELKANEEQCKALEEELANSTLNMSDIGDIKVNDLPGLEAIYAPGTKDGQTKIIKEGNKVSAHQWDSGKFQWVKIGDVVGASGAAHDPSQKEVFEGKEYDYVFAIDIQDGAPQLKLPYNVTEDPWTVAQTFIHKHELSQLYLDQIANFIMKNSQAMTISQTPSNEHHDPFTGGSRYMPQTNNGNKSEAKANNVEASHYFPQSTHLRFEAVNIEGMAKKLKEFSENVPADVRLNGTDIKLLLKLADVTLEVQTEQISLIKLLLSWPKNYIFPALDVIRLGLLLPRINEELCSAKMSSRLIDTLLVCGTDIDSTPNQTTALRALCNLFAHPPGEALALAHAPTIFKAIASSKFSTNKTVQIALATLHLNLAVSLYQSIENTLLKIDCLMSSLSLLKSDMDVEAQYRHLVTLGTLKFKDENIIQLVKNQDVFTILQACKIRPGKIGLCAQEILDRLK